MQEDFCARPAGHLFRFSASKVSIVFYLPIWALVMGSVSTVKRVGAARDVIVIAHRGASGFRPEHTLEAYRVAILQGADFIEPDLVPTRDGFLIARHENELSGTTDVAERPEFAGRKTVKVIDGVSVTGWFSEDFTLAEIKRLRARERIPDVRPRNTRFDGRFEVPTFDEIIDLVQAMERVTGRKVGIYPETKHPTYFAKEGTLLDGRPIHRSIGRMLIDRLCANHFTDSERIFIQSFEFESLLELRNEIMPAAGLDLPLVQLYGDVTGAYIQPTSNFSRPYDMVFNASHGADLRAIYGDLADLVEGGITPTTGYGHLLSREVIEFIGRTYAGGIGLWKESFLRRLPIDPPVDANRDGVAEVRTQLTGEVSPCLSIALEAGLLVHPYTLRAEERFLTLHPNGAPQSIIGEILQLLGLGVSGFFIDQPIEGVKGRELFFAVNDTARRRGRSGESQRNLGRL